MTQMRGRLAFVILFAVLACVGTACSDEVQPSATPLESTQVEKRFRAATTPDGPDLRVVATGSARSRIAVSVEDLRSVEVWRTLTCALDRIVVDVGARRIPKDGHLADARLEVRRAPGLLSRTCVITFFPNAIRADLDRQDEYQARGLVARVPSFSDFWSALLAHELAHCAPGARGERIALRWERQVIIALEAESKSGE